MAQGLEIDLKEIVLSNSTFGPNEIDQLTRTISGDASRVPVLRDSVGELEASESLTPAMAVRLGVCYYLLGRTTRAIETLRSSDGSALALFYLGRSLFATGEYSEAIASYNAAKGAGYNSGPCAWRLARRSATWVTRLRRWRRSTPCPVRLSRRPSICTSVGRRSRRWGGIRRKSWPCTSGRWRPIRGTPAPCLAWRMESDRRGDDERALEFCERAVQGYPTHVGSLLNLGLMYEDRLRFESAQACYRRILDSFPSDPRARLYYKDAAASGDMFFDEEAQKRNERINQVLGIPVTDFELSVRSRNCLQKMGVRTLGDLTRISELELLSSKNFGETSLIEIRDMLHSRGLDLGMYVDRRPEPEVPVDLSDLSPDEQAVLERPIADLNLSVRARKCMVRLGMSTLGELVRKTGDDLLECRTSA